MSEKMTLSLDGRNITEIARSRLCDDKEMEHAYLMIRACTKTNQLSEEESRHIALDILAGYKTITGTYPGNDYGVIDDKDFKEDLIIKTFMNISETCKKQESEIRLLQEKLTYIQEYLIENDNITYQVMKQMNDDYREIYEKKYLFSCFEDEYESMDMVADFLKQHHIKQSMPEDSSYGWLEPDGTFHPVEYGEHEKFAIDYLKKHYPRKAYPELYLWKNPYTDTDLPIEGGDILKIKLKWALLHSPTMGTAKVNKAELVELTERQKEFLVAYYNKRSLYETAKEYIN